jgi:hypothetical protein
VIISGKQILITAIDSDSIQVFSISVLPDSSINLLAKADESKKD